MPIYKDLPGSVEKTEIESGFEEYGGFLDTVQKEIHGMCLRPPKALTRVRDENAWWLAIARHEGKMIGALTYKIQGFQKSLDVNDFYYVNSLGKFLLLKWLAIHIDQVEEIKMNVYPFQRIENRAFDLRAKIESREWANLRSKL